MIMPALRVSLRLSVCWLAWAIVAPAAAETRVPKWSARGVGPLPSQGIACLDVGPDGTIVVGTIAAPGNPNVLVLDKSGQLVGRHAVGQRWISQVAFDGSEDPLAVCTMPEGRADDFPTVFRCGDSVKPILSGLNQTHYPQTLFHYGDHSNHAGILLRATSGGAVAQYGNRVLWLDGAFATPQGLATFPLPADGVTLSLAAHRDGTAVAGCAVASPKERDPPPNLFALRNGAGQPVWSRSPLTDIDDSEPPPKGLYGSPTLRNGKRGELDQSDVPMFGPLSLAVDREERLTRVATADYRGWQRWIRSSATGRDQNYGTRFVPSRPTISVFDAEGRPIRRFGPEKFAKPAWVDLAFLPGAKKLIASPHHWTCRGLAGQTILPADDSADTLWLLDVETGDVRSLVFPDAISDVSVCARVVGDDPENSAGEIGVGCWNGRFYRVREAEFAASKPGEGLDVGGPSLVRPAGIRGGWVVATTSGTVRVLDRAGAVVRRVDLDRLVEPTRPDWVAKARATKIAEGLWQLPGGRVESDLGGQRVIEAPDGLILIEGHAGLSFESEWAAMEAVGLDPKRVRYVLATHEHGDHAPGAYLWRVTTGAQFVCSEEMADTLQHHIPLSTGYGLHPPVPTDVRVAEDKTLNLAGLDVRAVRLPGHTQGSMGWLFEREGRKYVAIGDLIMPDGVLGYAGSVNFSATDVLSSLRKLDALKVDFVLPGHGPITGPDRYIAAGISIGRHVGWGKMTPEAPDPRYGITQKNVVVVAWNIDAASADFGDFNGDGKPDVAVVVPGSATSTIHIFLNHDGTFRDQPDHSIDVPGVADPGRLRARQLNDDAIPDFLVGGRTSESALVLSGKRFPEFEVVRLPLGDANQIRRVRVDAKPLRGGDGHELWTAAKFGAFSRVTRHRSDRLTLKPAEEEKSLALTPVAAKIGGPYIDARPLDLNGDGREDLATSYGQIFLRDAEDRLPSEPTQTLPLAVEKDWSFLAIGDFNGDRRPDICLVPFQAESARIAVFRNSGDAARPFAPKADRVVDLNPPTLPMKERQVMLRDAPAVGDWNGDGIDDLFVGRGQDRRIVVLLGGADGLSLDRSVTLALPYRLHHETGLFVADFNQDGLADVAALGDTRTGVGAGGPPAVYIFLQAEKK